MSFRFQLYRRQIGLSCLYVTRYSIPIVTFGPPLTATYFSSLKNGIAFPLDLTESNSPASARLLIRRRSLPPHSSLSVLTIARSGASVETRSMPGRSHLTAHTVLRDTTDK